MLSRRKNPECVLLRGRSCGGEAEEAEGGKAGGGGGELGCSIEGDWGPWDGCLGSGVRVGGRQVRV